MDVSKKGSKAVKNKKSVSFLLAWVLGLSFLNVEAEYGGSSEGISVARVDQGLEQRHETNPLNTNNLLLQRLRLRQQGEKPALEYIRPVKQTKGTVVTPLAPQPSTGLLVDSALLSPGTLARIAKEGKSDRNFAAPDAVFLPNGTMASRILHGKRQAITDPFLVEIRDQMKKQRKTYQNFFNYLSPKQKEQEQEAFEEINSDLGRLAKLRQDPNTSADEIAKAQQNIRTLISQMSKKTFNAAANNAEVKPVVVKPVDEGLGDDKPVDKGAPQGRGIGGQTYTPEEEAKAEAEIQRVLAEIALKKVQQKKMGNLHSLDKLVVDQEMEKTLGSSFKELQQTVYDVLANDPVVSAVTASRFENSNTSSMAYKINTNDLTKRVRLVAQEVRKVSKLVAKSDVTTVQADLTARFAELLGKYEGHGMGSSVDSALYERLEVDLKVCKVLNARLEQLQEKILPAPSPEQPLPPVSSVPSTALRMSDLYDDGDDDDDPVAIVEHAPETGLNLNKNEHENTPATDPYAVLSIGDIETLKEAAESDLRIAKYNLKNLQVKILPTVAEQKKLDALPEKIAQLEEQVRQYDNQIKQKKAESEA